MPFHAFVTPLDYVGLFATVRSFLYNDVDLISGNVVLNVQFAGVVRERGVNRPDSPIAYNYPGTAPEVGPDPANLRLLGQGWGVIGGQIYLATNTTSGPGGRIMGLVHADNGYIRNDVAVDVTMFDHHAGLIIHGGETRCILVYLDTASLRVKAATDDGQFIATNLFTGTTPITLGASYRLRVTEAADNTVSIYLNGVLEGTFNIAGLTVGGEDMTVRRGNGMFTTTVTSRFANFYIAPAAALPAATDYTVRNYEGDIVYTNTFAALTDPTKLTIPDSVLKQRNNRGPYGWYRVYLTGPNRNDNQWNDSYGDCAFARIPASNLPANSPFVSEPVPPGDTSSDVRARSVLGMGSSRYAIQNAALPPADNIAFMLPIVTAGKLLDHDTASAARPREVLVAFPNGTKGSEANITAIVDGLKPYVRAWEGRNEPNFTGGYENGGTWATDEHIPFYNAVKAGDPTAIVMAPGQVTFNRNSSGYMRQFFQAPGAAAAIDAVSVHAYNCYNGDLVMSRYNLEYLNTLTVFYGVPNLDIWQTEQGFGWNYAGLVYPRYSCRWTMMMYFAQEVATHGRMRVETTNYWYDTTIGFDTFPMYWLTPAGPGPTTIPVRTMSAEIWNKTFTSEFGFGDNKALAGIDNFGFPGSQPRLGGYAQNLYIGGVWSGTDGTKVVGLMAASFGANNVLLDVSGASSLTCVDPWGNTFTLPVVNGQASFPMSELPQWIRCPVGVTVTPVDMGLLTNLAPAATVTSDGVPGTGLTGNNLTYAQISATDVTLMNNDVVENQYNLEPQPYKLVDPPMPVTITLTWPSPVTLNRVIVFSYPPWQVLGTLTAFHIDTWDGASWTTRYTKTRPASRSFPFTSRVGRCTFETFFDEQHTFDAPFATTTTTKIRVVVTDTCYASGEIPGPYDALWGAWGQGSPPASLAPRTLCIREIQAFGGVPHTARAVCAATGTAHATRTTSTSDAQHAANLQAMRPYVRPDEQAAIDRAVALLAP